MRKPRVSKQQRGFAVMKPNHVKRIATLGGLTRSQDRISMAEAGRKGASARWNGSRKPS